MHLHSALEQIADRYGLDAFALTAYAAEDAHTGWDHGEGDWPTGSLWRVEGQVLYALVRALKPTNVLELGTWYGCSATHILQALEDNGHGTLLGVDNHVQGGPAAIGDMIPDALRERFTHQDQHIMEYVTTADAQFDLIFEDGMHDREQVAAVWSAAQRILAPGGFIVSHDATHFVVGADVQRGMAQAGITDALFLSIDPADCGLGIWRKPGEYVAQTEAEPKATPKPRKSRSKK
jgi:predicted O-methyltransferase YrrM